MQSFTPFRLDAALGTDHSAALSDKSSQHQSSPLNLPFLDALFKMAERNQAKPVQSRAVHRDVEKGGAGKDGLYAAQRQPGERTTSETIPSN